MELATAIIALVTAAINAAGAFGNQKTSGQLESTVGLIKDDMNEVVSSVNNLAGQVETLNRSRREEMKLVGDVLRRAQEQTDRLIDRLG